MLKHPTNEDLEKRITDIQVDVAVVKKSLEALIVQIDLRFNSSQTALTEALNNQKEATALLAKNNEKHFEFLNGEAARLIEMQATYIPREVYDANHKELWGKMDANYKDLDSKIDAVDGKFDGINEWKNTSIGRQSVMTMITATITSVLVGMAIYYITRG